MADKVELRLTKSTGQPWGFRLQGGKDFNMPIVIQKVNGGSPAEQAGLRAGDHVLCVADRDAGQLRHKQVQDLIISSGNCVTMTVIRGGMSPVRPPSLQPNNTPQHTPVPRARNPFSPVKTCTTDGAKKAIVHNQHNSPMPLYSDEKIAETLSAQAEVLTGGAMGVDFRKNEKKFDSQMSDVLRMVREMDEFPEQFRESESEFCENQSPEAAPHSGGSHTRSGHSIVVRPDSSQKEQFSVQQSVNSPIPQANAPFNMGPIKKKGPPVPQKPAKVPGMRSTSATVIRKDPESGGVKLVSVVDTETNHYNAFNRSPQTFKPAAVSAGQSSAVGRAPQLSPHAPMQEAMQTFPGQTQLSQVDYTSYVPQKKGGTSLMWPPPKTEECSIQQQSEGSSQPQLQQNVFDSKFSHQNPHMTPSQLPNTPLAQMSTISSMSTNKQMSFSSNNITSSTVSPGQPMNLPSMSAPGGGIRGLGAGGTAAPAPGPRNPTGPAAVPASGLGDAGAPPGSTGKSAVAGKNNGPKRGRGQRKAAGSMSRIPMCSACGNQIRGPFIAALGQCWCPGCFVCSTSQCRQNLENIGFVEVEEKIHCENCWESYLAPTCSKCRKRIKEDCLKACGTSYHPECFACAYCGGLFGNSAFFMEDGLPYCENDWNELFTTKCVGCGFPIEAGDRWVEALNKNFHAQCFKCAICGSNLEGQSFLSKQGRPFCKHHARM